MEQTWVIAIGGYGSFFFKGTEEKAEEMRRHKANWEQGPGRKRLADENEIKLNIIDECKNHKNFKTKGNFFCRCGNCKK